MTEKIKSEVEEEEEEEEDSVIDVRHRKFIYKVRSVQSPDHPTTSFHMVANAPTSSNSSYLIKLDQPLTQKSDSYVHFSDEILLPRNPEYPPSSVMTNIQQSPVPMITFNENEQFPSFETNSDVLDYLNQHHPTKMIDSTDQIQQLNTSYEQFPDIPISTGTTFDNADYTFNNKFDTSFPLPKNIETNKTDVSHYDEIHSDVLLQNNNISHTQHAPLFGCVAENLYNFATSAFDLLERNNADNVNVTVSDDHSSGQQIITSLTEDGQTIICGLSVRISEKLNNDQENVSNTFNALKTDEETVSLPMPQIMENSSEQDLIKHITRNEATIGLTGPGEFVIDNVIDNNSWESTHLILIVMGLTASGEIICGGCISDTIAECVFTTSEKIIDSSNQHATVDIVANLTANNEKVLTGLTDSNFTSICNGSLLRRDSF